MNAILGMIDLALSKVIDPTVQDCLQTVRGSGDLLLALLNDLLDSARIEAGKLELESAPFSLRRILGPDHASARPCGRAKRESPYRVTSRPKCRTPWSVTRCASDKSSSI